MPRYLSFVICRMNNLSKLTSKRAYEYVTDLEKNKSARRRYLIYDIIHQYMGDVLVIQA